MVDNKQNIYVLYFYLITINFLCVVFFLIGNQNSIPCKEVAWHCYFCFTDQNIIKNCKLNEIVIARCDECYNKQTIFIKDKNTTIVNDELRYGDTYRVYNFYLFFFFLILIFIE